MSSFNADSDTPADTKAFARRLLRLPGVTSGFMHRYEISVSIGEAFRWQDVGPQVLGEIIRSVYPEVDGDSLDISVSIGWRFYSPARAYSLLYQGDDDGYQTRYLDIADHTSVAIDFGTRQSSGNAVVVNLTAAPKLDIEYLFQKEIFETARYKQQRLDEASH